MKTFTQVRFPEAECVFDDNFTKKLIVSAQNGNLDDRDTLVNNNLRLVMSIVQRMGNNDQEKEDLFQIGCLGLIKAIDKFDISRDVRFSTYAVPLIIGEIKRYRRDNHPVKVSRSYREIAIKVWRVQEDFASKHGREPSIIEIAEQLSLPAEQIVEALDAVQTPVSIFEPIKNDDPDGGLLFDQLPSPTSEQETDWLDSYVLKQSLENLDEREKTIVYLRFFKGKTQSEVADRLGISQVQISRLEKKILLKIRSNLT